MNVVRVADSASAYRLRATAYRDPALMSGRNGAITQTKLARVCSLVPVPPGGRVLDVGPGDGTLFRLIGTAAGTCVGIDQFPESVARLQGLFAGVPNTRFVLTPFSALPRFDEPFDVIVCNSVLHMLSDKAEAEALLCGLRPLSHEGTQVFVGEVPFVPERRRGLAVQIGTLLRTYGLRASARAMVDMYVAPLVRREPLLIEPVGRTLVIPPEEFENMVERAGFRIARQWRHQDCRLESASRNDYLLVPRTDRKASE